MSESISISNLKEALASQAAPVVFDVRKKPAFDSDPRTIQGAEWRAFDDVKAWASEIANDDKVVVYCVHGHEVSQSAARGLRELGFDATYLDGGIATWIEEGNSVS
ncbi:MAG: rhodanese-like domain-containing protein [Cocleimonas sp.]